MNRDNSEGDFQILLIEDREDDVEITREALNLTDSESELRVVKDGKRALDYLFQQGDYEDVALPDLILLDLNLPKIDGREVLEKINDDEKLRSIPTIVLTVSDRDKDIARSYDSGAAGYITKPIDFEEFAKAIDIVKKYWSICERPSPEREG